jgi:hypothetical protein
MRSHHTRAALANNVGGGAGGDDLSSTFTEFSNRFIASNTYMGSNADYNGPYDVAELQTDFVGSGRIYIIQKNYSSGSTFYNDCAIAGVQIISGTTLVRSWIFNTNTGGSGSGWTTTTTAFDFGSADGLNITTASLSGYTYSAINDTKVNGGDKWIYATSTGSSNTGAADGVGDTYKLSADGGSNTLAPVGDGTISQTSSTYFVYRETSQSQHDEGAIMRSPAYTFSGGEYIRIIHALPGYSITPMDPDDALFMAVK